MLKLRTISSKELGLGNKSFVGQLKSQFNSQGRSLTMTVGFYQKQKWFALLGLSTCFFSTTRKTGIFASLVQLKSSSEGDAKNLCEAVFRHLDTLRTGFQQDRLKFQQFLINHKFYKGLRYTRGLPVRGQRTHTNAQTVRKLNKIR